MFSSFQVRLPKGNNMVSTFPAHATLQSVMDFVLDKIKDEMAELEQPAFVQVKTVLFLFILL